MSSIVGKAWLLAAGLAFIAGCQDASQGGDHAGDGAASAPAPAVAPTFHADSNPDRLSEWGLLQVKEARLRLNTDVIPYDLNSALFSDYAHKLRTVWLPDGKTAEYQGQGVFDFPVGTVISKTFYYPLPEGGEATGNRVSKGGGTDLFAAENALDLGGVRLIETRILVHREEGWVALPYIWNEAQNDAVLKRAGDVLPLTLAQKGTEQEFAYIVPNTNQCQGCHATNATTRKLEPIGPKARHLNRDFAYSSGNENQLVAWSRLGLLSGAPAASDAPQNANWNDQNAPLNGRARAYLDINCSHCHNRAGPADTSGLLLEPHDPEGPSMGTCKLPIAAGTGTGDRKFGIVPGKPGESIFTFRMNSTDPAVMMPELGRAVAHDEGVALIREWIAEMEGGCG